MNLENPLELLFLLFGFLIRLQTCKESIGEAEERLLKATSCRMKISQRSPSPLDIVDMGMAFTFQET
jgi:hypothetical protein